MDSRFQVVVEEAETIFQQFSRPNEVRHNMDGNSWQTSYALGSVPLDIPAEKLDVSGQSNGKHYSLHATVQSADIPGGILEHHKLNLPVKQLAKHFGTKKVGEAVYVTDEREREEYVVHQDDSLFGWLTIELGSSGGDTHGFSTPPKKITTFDNFEKDMQRFAKVVEVVVNGVYEEAKKVAPKITLYLRPEFMAPTHRENPLSGLFGDVEKDVLQKAIEVQKLNVSFDDVGGQDGAKREIQGLSFALKNPKLYQRWGTKPPKGILLSGPPGTGKTLMARALASEANAKFFHVKVSDVSSMWYGQSSKLMQAVFDLARENGPSIIFFDELDALASQRDFSHEATQRVVSVMLENLDGLDSAENIMVVASTNRPDAIDPAIKRPGRIDRIVEVPLPDDAGRLQILGIHLAKAEKIAERKLTGEISFDTIIGATKQMSGADIAEIVRRVLEEKVRKEGMGEEQTLVSTEDIMKEVKSYERVKESQRIGFSHQK